MFAVFRKWIRRCRERPRGPECEEQFRLVLRDAGFDVFQDSVPAVLESVRWREVRAIRTYKLDVFAYDIICLAFQVEDGSWVQIMERNRGFMAVADAMRGFFPNISERWYDDVMMPAFATNDTLLYRRDDESGEWPD